MELFPGQYIHVGGDEAVKDQWQAVGARAGAHARAGVPSEGGLQGISRTGWVSTCARTDVGSWGGTRFSKGRARGCNGHVMARGAGAITAAASAMNAVLSPDPTST